MIKKITILGMDTEQGKKTFDFFIKYPHKYKIEGVSLTKETISEEIIKILKKNTVKEILVKNQKIKEQLEETLLSNINISTKPNFFIKKSLSDIVFFSVDDVNCVTQILSAISEYKDVCFIDWIPLLYTGKIVFNEIKNKGIKLYPISTTIYSIDQILLDSREYLLECIGLVNTYKKKDDYLKNPKQYDFREFKERFYSFHFINVIYDMFLLSSIYNLSSNKFCFYEQNKNIVNAVVTFQDGSNIINYSSKDLYVPFNYYFLNKADIKKINFCEKYPKTITDFSILQIDSKKHKILDVAINCLNKNVYAPILFYITIENLIQKLYDKKITLKKLETILEEIVFNKSYYSKSLDLKTIIALNKKIQKNIEKKL
jgi:1-deoxy-D-xylulose 5-phosphate reductoisomerase